MPYVYIDPSRYDAESPITESLMTDIIGNIDAVEAIAEGTWSPLTGTGTYTIPTGVTKLRVIAVSGGGGGAGGNASGGGGGGGGGRVKEFIYTPSPSEISSGVSYSCGAGGTGSHMTNGVVGGSSTFGTETLTGGLGGITGGGLGGNYDEYGQVYAGGIGGKASTVDGGSGYVGRALTPVFGVAGSGGGLGYGGGGGPLSLFFGFDGVESYLGNGGNGAAISSNGTNATVYGAGGGGGGYLGTTGGNGSAGVIFVQTLTV